MNEIQAKHHYAAQFRQLATVFDNPPNTDAAQVVVIINAMATADLYICGCCLEEDLIQSIPLKSQLEARKGERWNHGEALTKATDILVDEYPTMYPYSNAVIEPADEDLSPAELEECRNARLKTHCGAWAATCRLLATLLEVEGPDAVADSTASLLAGGPDALADSTGLVLVEAPDTTTDSAAPVPTVSDCGAIILMHLSRKHPARRFIYRIGLDINRDRGIVSKELEILRKANCVSYDPTKRQGVSITPFGMAVAESLTQSVIAMPSQ